ncbi:hypothetical protein J3459_008232 [Metarhizium acridum]|nr:hypothetical protein J3459_018042 [Metarhizium acridum]KAG8408362.1 hypothetical protein J3459_017872 [Metarhizium acridum]KAG8426318.1 hypothetical protein J3459_008232 [Metarhizium acridum]
MIDVPITDLDNMNSEAETLRCIEHNMAIAFCREVEEAGRSSLPDFVDRCRGRRNIYVLGLLRRALANASSAANEN